MREFVFDPGMLAYQEETSLEQGRSQRCCDLPERRALMMYRDHSALWIAS